MDLPLANFWGGEASFGGRGLGRFFGGEFWGWEDEMFFFEECHLFEPVYFVFFQLEVVCIVRPDIGPIGGKGSAVPRLLKCHVNALAITGFCRQRELISLKILIQPRFPVPDPNFRLRKPTLRSSDPIDLSILFHP